MEDNLNERGSMRSWMNTVAAKTFARNDPLRPEFGNKTKPNINQVNDAGKRRLQGVTDRANDEKMSYGFLQTLKRKAFGNKAPEPEFKRPERSEDERRAAVIDRAKNQGS